MNTPLASNAIAPRLCFAGAALAFFTVSPGLFAQSVWDGGGVDNNFLTPANWAADTAPITGTTTVVQFAGSTQTSPVLNSDFELKQLTLNSGAGAFSLSGTGILSVFGNGTSGLSSTVGVLNSSGSLLTVGNALKLTGNSYINADVGSLTVSGNIDGGTSNRLGLRAGTGGVQRTLTVSGVISGSLTEVQLRGAGGGTFTGIVRLSGNNTFTASTLQIFDGNLRLAHSNALGSSANTLQLGNSAVTTDISILTEGAVTIAQGMRLVSKAGAGTYTIGGGDASTSTYSGNITVNSNTASSTAMPLIVTAATGGRVNFTGNILRDGNSTGSGDSLTKTGAGIVSLAGSGNTYSGTTTVSAGTLLVNGTLATGGAVSVSASATLGGAGTINRDVTIANSAIFTPGDMDASSVSQVGTLTVNTLTFSGADSKILLDVGSIANSDKIAVSTSGGLAFNGDLTLKIASGIEAGTYDLFSFTGSPTGSFDSVSLTGLESISLSNSSGVWTGTSGNFTYTFTQATGDLVVTSLIPEPSSYAMLAAMGALGLTLLRRNRRQS